MDDFGWALRQYTQSAELDFEEHEQRDEKTFWLDYLKDYRSKYCFICIVLFSCIWIEFVWLFVLTSFRPDSTLKFLVILFKRLVIKWSIFCAFFNQLV